jgi:hypothetical protein
MNLGQAGTIIAVHLSAKVFLTQERNNKGKEQTVLLGRVLRNS